MTRLSHKKALDPSKYANIETGEQLSSEMPTLSSVNITDPNLVLVSSKEYMIIDSQALRYISQNFNNADLANILKMTDMVKGVFNVLYNDKKPHTTETLKTNLDYSVNKFRDFLNRLYKGGVISYLLSCKKGVDHRFIVLNPKIARKGKIFDKEALSLFKDVDFNQKVDIKYPKHLKKISTDKADQIIENLEVSLNEFTADEIDMLFDDVGTTNIPLNSVDENDYWAWKNYQKSLENSTLSTAETLSKSDVKSILNDIE